MKHCVFALIFTVLTAEAHALTKVLCSGKHQGKSVVLNAQIEKVSDPKSGMGTVSVDGREVAEFGGADAKINYIFLSAKVQNARGEILEGKVTDLTNGSALVTRLLVPGYGIDFKNITITCVETTLLRQILLWETSCK